MSRPLKTGLTAQTKKHFLLDEGAIFKNFVVGTDTFESAIAAGKCLGATQGGSEFKAVASIRNIDVDGVPGEVADLDKIEKWEITLATTFLEVTKDTICAALGAAATDTDTAGYTHITGKTDFDDDDYFDNITFIGTVSGSTNPIIIQVRNALSGCELGLSFKKGAEGTIPVTFNGKYNFENLTDAPFDIYYPDIMTASTYAVTISGTGNQTVDISGAALPITAVSSAVAKATATVTSSAVKITGVAAGTADITVTDSDGNSLVIKATITS